VITACGPVVAHLGGWRGDQLFVAEDGGELRPVAELGWDAHSQTTPQRRLRVTAEAIFVLEPTSGPLLVPPLRVRRFDRSGRETGREEGAEASDAADLYFLAERGTSGIRLRRAGLDAATGRPLFWEGTLEVELMHSEPYCSGVPLATRGAWWYPVREEGLVRVGPGGHCEVLPGQPAPVVEAVGDRAVCVGTLRGRPGAWVDGTWHALAGRPRFPAYRFPRLGIAVAGAGSDIVVLRRDGGDLPVLGGGRARLARDGAPYTGLVAVPGALLALTETGEPRLQPVEL
jgi:hypothetical protein